jgi:hypothetical protein
MLDMQLFKHDYQQSSSWIPLLSPEYYDLLFTNHIACKMYCGILTVLGGGINFRLSAMHVEWSRDRQKRAVHLLNIRILYSIKFLQLATWVPCTSYSFGWMNEWVYSSFFQLKIIKQKKKDNLSPKKKKRKMKGAWSSKYISKLYMFTHGAVQKWNERMRQEKKEEY